MPLNFLCGNTSQIKKKMYQEKRKILQNIKQTLWIGTKAPTQDFKSSKAKAF